MYENETAANIEARMLRRVPASLDKREGSVIYDATAPASIEFELLYAAVDYFLKNTFGDTADREFLIERAKERGLSPYPASAAVIKVIGTPADVEIPIGARFSYDDVNYTITEKLETEGEYTAVCETAGTIGNKPEGNLIPIEYIAGLQSAKCAEVVVFGEDEEDTESFRARYLASFNTQAYGGNIQDYQEKVSAIPGVGGVKVYPVWQGGGTVKVVFSTSENTVPSAELVSDVQEILDPVPYQQQGVGVAPIGHRVTVEGAKESAVNIGLNIVFGGGDTFASRLNDIRTVIQNYFAELNAGWQATEVVTSSAFENRGIIVRISQIESRLLQESYVQDISHTTLNGAEENIELANDALATIGDITDVSGGA